jgi:hypothetical protein
MLAQSLLLLVPADHHRLHPLCRPQDLGCGAAAPRSERGWAVGSVPVLCRPFEVRVQGAGDPIGANKGVFLLAPLVTVTLALLAWAVIPVE